MQGDFRQSDWDDVLTADLQELIRLAIREDLGQSGDLTTQALVGGEVSGRAAVMARQTGVIAGLRAAELACVQIDRSLAWSPMAIDGQTVQPGDRLATVEGPAASLLAAERLLLNLLGRLSGIATLTRQYVEAVAGAKARIYDTRKTTPGWRRLEKYAVRAGGGRNHRTGLFDAVLIKDNHLALGAQAWSIDARTAPAEAVLRARRFLCDNHYRDLSGVQPLGPTAREGGSARRPEEQSPSEAGKRIIVEIEVDTLEQLAVVLPACPDLILLDNMSPAQLREAVARRDALAPAVELEASGGVNLQTVRAIAESGVDRISVGALTHSAVGLDVALDWLARGE